MSDTPIKQQLLEMSLDGILEVISIIKTRPDIASLLITTQREVDEQDEFYKKHYEKIIARIDNEPA